MRTVPGGGEPATETITVKVTRSLATALRKAAHASDRNVSQELRSMLRQRFEGSR